MPEIARKVKSRYPPTINRGLIRMKSVEDLTGFNRRWLYMLIKDGKFPQPVRTGKRATAFVRSEVLNWVDKKIEGRNAV